MKQNEIDEKMTDIVDEFKDFFVGLGRAKRVDPIHLEIDETMKLGQQKRRPILLKYVERFESLLDDLTSPLDHESATGWIHNPIIEHKKYGNKIS